MSQSGRVALFAFGGILVVLILGFVWPSAWVYGTTPNDMYRVNRFTGTKEWATDFGWLTAEEHIKALEARRLAELGDTARQVLEDVKAGKIVAAHQTADQIQVTYSHGGVATFQGSDVEHVQEALARGGQRNWVVEK